MSTGECNAYADTTFSDLLVEYHRIGDVCSNVGIATLVRVHPELADHEHLHFEQLHSGGDEGFDAAYKRVYQRYFTLLTRPDTEQAAEPKPEEKEEQTAAKDDPDKKRQPSDVPEQKADAGTEADEGTGKSLI